MVFQRVNISLFLVVGLCLSRTLFAFLPPSSVPFRVLQQQQQQQHHEQTNNSKIKLQMFGLETIFKSKSQSSKATTIDDTSSYEMDVPRVAVRSRPMVSLDETTGTYISPQQLQQQSTSSSTSSSSSTSFFSSDKQDDSGKSSFKWSIIKDVFYNILDSASTIPKVVMGSNKNQIEHSILNRKLAVAYSDTVEFKNQNQIGISLLADDTNKANEAQLVKQYTTSLSSSGKDRSDGDDLFRSDTRKSFDAAKDGIYDLFTGSTSKKESTMGDIANGAAKKKTPIENIIRTSSIPTDVTTFKPVSKPSNNKDTTMTKLTPYFADLNSSNPITVAKAKFAIAMKERTQRRRIQEQKRREAVDDAKQKVFTVIDAIQSFATLILNLPKQIEDSIQTAEEAIQQTKLQTIQTVKDVQAIPSKVKQTVKDTKRSVEDTQRAALKTVEEVKSIPQKIEQSVVNTKKSIKETKQGVENFVQKAEDLTFDAKVIAGLEQPKPKPPPSPPPPPPPKSSKEIAMDVAGTVAKTTGKLALDSVVVVGKGTIGLTTNAVKIAYSAATAPKERTMVEAKKEKKETKREHKGSLLSRFTKSIDLKKDDAAAKAKAKASTSVVEPSIEIPKTIGEIDPLLEKEVADALRSAEEALDSAKREENNPKTSLTNIEINVALEKARLAAAQARTDAEELEQMLEQKKEFFMKQ